MRRALLLLAPLLAACGAPDEPADFSPPARGVQIRPDTPGNNLMFRFDPAEVVETYGSAQNNFLIHYTRMGKDAVPAVDADMSGVPDFVEEAATIYEDVAAFYHGKLGFLAPLSDANQPDNGGDGRFDVYLLDFNGQGDGHYETDVCDAGNLEQCDGYMLQENDFKGYPYPSTTIGNRILASHEFFHATQAAYDTGQGSVMAEGTAVWATETFDSSLSDFEGFLPGYFDNPDRSLDQPLPGAVDPFSYGAAIYFEFLEERFGSGTIRGLWERLPNGTNGNANPNWFTELDPYLKTKNSSFAQAFEEFAVYNLFTGKSADPSRSYKNGAGYSTVHKTPVDLPYQKAMLRVFYASSQYYVAAPGARTSMSAALVGPAAETDGLSLFLAVRRGDAYDPVKQVKDLGAGTETIDTSKADTLVALVVNTTQQNPSKRPGLCIGDADEVASCVAALGGTGAGGAGGAGAGGSGAGEGGGVQNTPLDKSSGCGCEVAGMESGNGWVIAVAVFAAGAQRRRARTRTRTCTRTRTRTRTCTCTCTCT